MKFLHSMIRVKNEEKSLKFYCELLGLKKGDRIRLEDCYLQYLIDEETNTQIEFTINDETPSSGYQAGNAFGHFAFECDDLDIIDKKIKEMGYCWDVEPFYMPEVRTRISFLSDPDNNSIELIEKIK